MAHITNTLQPHFTGHVGPVRFTNGHAETTDADMVAYFKAQPDAYDVTEDDEQEGTANEGVRNKHRRVARSGDGAE